MGFGIPDFSEIEQLGKNLVEFMSTVKLKLDVLFKGQSDNELALIEVNKKLDLIISILKDKP